MSKGRRYNGEQHLNYAKVFAVLIAIVVIIMSVFLIKKLVSKAKNTKKLGQLNILHFIKMISGECWGQMEKQL